MRRPPPTSSRSHEPPEPAVAVMALQLHSRDVLVANAGHRAIECHLWSGTGDLASVDVLTDHGTTACPSTDAPQASSSKQSGKKVTFKEEGSEYEGEDEEFEGVLA